ncbi:hypothetical protein CFP65_4838 [Kitasatospora sp. MMS16-BH015]|uniref:hypothetical protein n=1 Tax=Kitasatospora sp. MMS16-BH015 TaxID=2018025 RepID=UPI000CA37B08|nr:hypothetical protein [Kitasatospora sp. MMS16-BH015]AUG79558.1 hypothetical protein CFP65_4838 [Kitasatospora sp. MMS16-BH015]
MPHHQAGEPTGGATGATGVMGVAGAVGAAAVPGAAEGAAAAVGESAAGEPVVGDPVRELMVRHRVVCEQAVDPLEIAAALEDSGLGQAEVGRYRHADVFGLAEELFARVPRAPRVSRERGDAGVAGRERSAFGWVGWGQVVAGLALAVPLWEAEPGLGAAAAEGVVMAEVVGGWLDRVARGHLGQAGTIAEYRGRMRPVLPVAALLQVAMVLLLGFLGTVLSAGEGPGGLLHRAVAQAGVGWWGTLAVLGVLQLFAVTLRRRGRPMAALAAPLLALAVAAAGVAVGGPPGTALRFGGGAVAVVVLPYAWVLLGRPALAEPT